ncbi:hypothetical protein [Muricoccus vinaceus]|uniref:Glycosyl transferase n=1 Tax=Muricoccus vinaceus TaxID=424704 RepID=A0ABV6IZM5_9PROT
MSKNVHCFTSVSFSYLDRARVLVEAVKRFHPDWTFWLGISDEEPDGFDFDPAQEMFDRVLWIKDLGIADLQSWIFKHNVVELCTAVKGQMLLHLLEQGADNVIYLDPDIAVFGTLSPVLDLLDTHNVVLTPHVVMPEKIHTAITDNEIGTLKHGIYNLGFLAVRNSKEGRRFSEWWRDRLLKYCYEAIEEGLFTDQRWCDLAPCFFDGVYILRDPGYNVASWNLNHRLITFDEQGTILAGGSVLRFFHFTKVNSVGEVMLERYSHGQIGVFELLKWYRQRLVAHSVAGLPPKWWKFGRFDNGQVILPNHRLLYRHREDLQHAFPNPFSTSGYGYLDWFNEHGMPLNLR